ncbi:MAG: hydantoinase/oxoprolinase family protein, partial [Pseudomonadota bacterium]
TDLDDAVVAAMREAFEREYARQFSRPVPGMSIEILNWCLRLGTVPSWAENLSEAGERQPAVPAATREIRCDLSGDLIEAALFWRPDLVPGSTVTGPALISEAQTTTFVSADFDAWVDGAGNLRLSRKEVEP